MKSLTILGIVLFGVATLLFYATTNFALEEMKLSHIMGIMAGIGLGLIIGGVVGYMSKGTAVKEAEKRKAYKELQKQNAELEKITAQSVKPENTGFDINKNPQNF